MTDFRDNDKRRDGRSSKPFREGGNGKPFGGKFRDRDGGKPFGKPRFDRPRFDKPGFDGPRSRPERTGELRPADAEERIAKVIARAGIASRRDAEALIAEGRVTLEGEVLTSPAINVGPFAKITIDGEPLPERERTRLWLYHKPRGLVTTARDPEGRATVFENLPEDMPRVISIGRLDINTEGLLLLTNDGGLARVIAHPDTGWLRRYKVRAHGDITQADLDKLADGITIDDIEYGPVEARLDRVQGDNCWLTLGLREGKNREVKRILEHIGLAVNRLIRLSFGPFQLGDLEAGLVEEVRTKVLKEQLGEALAIEANVDFVRPVREPVATHAPRRYEDDADGEGEFDPHAERREREMAHAMERRERGRAVWRADESDDQQPRRGKGPRRDGDPREARQASERPRQRMSAIASGSGRSVRVERFVPDASEERSRERQSFHRDEEHGDGERPFRRDDRGDFKPRRSFGEGRDRPFGDRPRREDGEGFKPRRSFGEGRDKPFGDRPRREDGEGFKPRRSFGEGRDKPFGDRPPRREGGSDFKPRRSFGEGRDKPFGDRPPRREGGEGFKPRRSFGEGRDKPFGDRPPRREGGEGFKPRRAFGEGRDKPGFGGDRKPGRPGGKPSFGKKPGGPGRGPRAGGPGKGRER